MKHELKQQAMEASPLAGTVPPRKKARNRETTMAGKSGSWRRLIATLAANGGDLPHLEVLRDRLEAMVGQVADLQKQQAAHRAAMQETSRELQEMLVEGARLATLLRLSVKQHYGIRSEKLVEFGVQPFRGRRPQEVVPPPAVGAAVPALEVPETPASSSAR